MRAADKRARNAAPVPVICWRKPLEEAPVQQHDHALVQGSRQASAVAGLVTCPGAERGVDDRAGAAGDCAGPPPQSVPPGLAGRGCWSRSTAHTWTCPTARPCAPRWARVPPVAVTFGSGRPSSALVSLATPPGSRTPRRSRQRVDHHPGRQLPQPLLDGPALGEDRVDHLERHDLGQPAQVARSEDTLGHRDLAGDDTLSRQRSLRSCERLVLVDCQFCRGSASFVAAPPQPVTSRPWGKAA